MATSSAELHEAAELLDPATIDRHRAIVSLMEELEAVDWYDQRIDVVQDPELRTILEHNRDEEKEHAAMVLEWLRRRDHVLDENLRQFLFTDGPISHSEAGDTGDGDQAKQADAHSPAQYSLGIGSLRGRSRG